MLSSAHNQAGIVRVKAALAPYSGACLQALPCSATGIRLDNASIWFAIAKQRGASVWHVATPHTWICGATVDSSGTHGLSCHNLRASYVTTWSINNSQPQKSFPYSSQNISSDQIVAVQMDCLRSLGMDDVLCGTSHALTRWRNVIWVVPWLDLELWQLRPNLENASITRSLPKLTVRSDSGWDFWSSRWRGHCFCWRPGWTHCCDVDIQLGNAAGELGTIFAGCNRNLDDIQNIVSFSSNFFL